MTTQSMLDFIVPEFPGAPPLGYARDLPAFANDTAYAAHSPQTGRYVGQSDYNGLSDLYYNNRPLAQTVGDASGGMKADHFLGCFNTFLTAGYTIDQLAAAGAPNQYTLMTVGLYPFTGSVSHSPVTTKVATPGNARRVSIQCSSSFNHFALVYYDNGFVQTGASGDAPGAWRDTQDICHGISVDPLGVTSFLGYAGKTFSNRILFPVGATVVIGGPTPAFGPSNVNTPVNTKTKLILADTSARTAEDMAGMYFDQIRPECAADGSNV